MGSLTSYISDQEDERRDKLKPMERIVTQSTGSVPAGTVTTIDGVEAEGTEASEIAEDAYTEWLSDHDDIAAAYNALLAIDGIDKAMQKPDVKKKMEQIRVWAIDIIHHSLKIIKENRFG